MIYQTNDLLLAINKPINWPSHRVVSYLRKHLQVKKIGFAGTLDPFATGLMIVGVGKQATKQLGQWSDCNKSYIATIRFGIHSNTDDFTGDLTLQGEIPTEEQIIVCIDRFIGKQLQVPPQFSAIHVNGVRAYQKARKGIRVELSARPIEIFQLKILNVSLPDVTIEIECTKGTYIRALARDFGLTLNTNAMLTTLTRTKIDTVDLTHSETPEIAVSKLISENEDLGFLVATYPKIQNDN